MYDTRQRQKKKGQTNTKIRLCEILWLHITQDITVAEKGGRERFGWYTGRKHQNAIAYQSQGRIGPLAYVK